MVRQDARKHDALRPVKLTRGVMKYAHGSCLIEMGDTKVMCTASTEEKVPVFLQNSDSGWITAEYGMLPCSCRTRVQRDVSRRAPSGRSQEIQRLIGRSLRAVVDLKALGPRTIWLDCDVLQADGGTRAAAITGSFVALADLLKNLKKESVITCIPVNSFVAAVSVGIVKGDALLDLNFQEDSRAELDMNLVMTSESKIIEIQATAERRAIEEKELEALMKLAKKGITQLIQQQKDVLSDIRFVKIA
jgi:ribonuclease PH